MRQFLALATILSLLLCPYRCMGGLVVVGDSAQHEHAQHEQVPSCPCCHTPHAADSPAGDEAPVESDGDCGDCLCKGAVFSEEDVSLATAADAPGFAMPPVDIDELVLCQAAPGLSRHRGDVPPPEARLDGRRLLLAVQSLLL
jgi:hypothetical protein